MGAWRGWVVGALFTATVVQASVQRLSTSPTTIDASDVKYQLRGPNTVERTVASALAERVSVLDFGAHPSATVDVTVAFQNALNVRGDWPIEVFVPEGEYTLNGCVSIASRRTLHLMPGAVLIRRNCSSVACAMLNVMGAEAALIGDRGSEVKVACAGGADFGIVHLGPESLHKYLNVEWNRISGVRIVGPSSGGIGLLVDSSEPFVGGSCYQNTIEDLVISDVDVGVRAVKYVNANRFSNLQMLSIGQYGVEFVNNTENSLSGIFVSSSRNITAVIRGEGSGFNSFANVQSEPGGGKLMDFDARSFQNRVDGHDNCPHGSVVHDAEFTWVSGGRIMVGNFSSAPLGYRRQLTVEGDAYIKSLEHGLPRVARDSRSLSALRVVEGAPMALPTEVAAKHGGALAWTLCGFAPQQGEAPTGRVAAGHVDLRLTVSASEVDGTPVYDAVSDARVIVRRVTQSRPPRVVARSCDEAGGQQCPVRIDGARDGCVVVRARVPPRTLIDAVLEVQSVGAVDAAGISVGA